MRGYRDSVAAALSAALAAALAMSAVDLVLAARRADGLGGHAAELAWLLVGLYALPCALAGVGAGLIVGAWRASSFLVKIATTPASP